MQVEKAVFTGNLLFILLTFTVKEACNVDASLKTIRAMVNNPFSHNYDYQLEEWMFKQPAQVRNLSTVLLHVWLKCLLLLD